MPHKTFTEIGTELATGWGTNVQGSLDEFLKEVTDSRRTVYLLAAVVSELRNVNAAISKLQRTRNQRAGAELIDEQSDVVADGMLHCLFVAMGDTPISELDATKLSIRAQRALMRADVSRISHVTRETLADVVNCGEVTINEIMEWVRAEAQGGAR